MNSEETLPEFPWEREAFWMKVEETIRLNCTPERADILVPRIRAAFDTCWFDVRTIEPVSLEARRDDHEEFRKLLQRAGAEVASAMAEQFRQRMLAVFCKMLVHFAERESYILNLEDHLEHE